MSWGVIKIEPEVVQWLEQLPDNQFGRVESSIDRLGNLGVHLGEPHTRQLSGKLRELRFYLGSSGDAYRSTYYVATGRRIVLLTVFRKQRRRERAEIKRAMRAMDRCITEGHTTEAGDE
ncbi:MAG: type II toxin-antitoxin system RelE/ParE family toxin [Actinomycetia bacterium]|nr:type II toxin-antitoxin system RelE/ParE family toxin [Actinomycetes bacterium]